MDKPERFADRLNKIGFKDRYFPGFTMIHKANSRKDEHCGRYDFMSTCGLQRLSCKTSKKGGCSVKVAPQVIGQATPQTFCNRINIEYVSDLKLKETFCDCSELPYILSELESNTFDVPILYYVETTDKLKYIVQKNRIEWSDYLDRFQWTQNAVTWKGSSTLKIDKKAILEVQFHNNRSNMAIRWSFENLLMLFSHNFHIDEL
jgi:hypothetical protein